MNAHGTYYVVLGASDGSMTAYELGTNQFIDGGEKKWCISGEIGHTRCNNQSMVVASSSGTIARFEISQAQMFPIDSKQVQLLKAEGPVISLAMDDLNNEGIAATSNGSIYYINFTEKIIIRIVNKAYSVQTPITSIRFNESNPELIITNCGNRSGLAKIWTSSTLDQVMKFGAPTCEGAGPVVFVLSAVNGAKYSFIGHSGGLVRLLNIENLKVECCFRIPLEEGETVTAGVFNPNGINFSVGTSQGHVFLGSSREDT
jgi:WD40 repeat protein